MANTTKNSQQRELKYINEGVKPNNIDICQLN